LASWLTPTCPWTVEGMLEGAAPLTARARHSKGGSSLAAEEEGESSPAPLSAGSWRATSTK